MSKKVFVLAILASISLNYASAQVTNQPRDSVRVIGKVADMLTSQPVFDVEWFCVNLGGNSSPISCHHISFWP